mmetsp:Transcript_40831/g.86945  ORF Transcript_40831/g.86945 Transcript_40831/m.86945 type:complete len:251 (+) Transcript_40831:1395-2147(+)
MMDGGERPVQLHERHVRRPQVDLIEDVRREYHRHPSLVALLREVVEEPIPAEDVQVGRELVDDRQLERLEQLEHETDLLPLSVAALVEAPVEVHAQHLDELVAPFDVVRLPLGEHFRRRRVEGVRTHPLESRPSPLPPFAEVRHAVDLIVHLLPSVDVELVEGDVVPPDHARESPDKRALAGAVGSHEYDLGIRGHDAVQVDEVLFLFGVVREVEVLDGQERFRQRRRGRRGGHADVSVVHFLFFLHPCS